MTIFYPPNLWGTLSAPPSSTYDCPIFMSSTTGGDGESSAVVLNFDGDVWRIIDPMDDAVLAEFPANQYHQVIGYFGSLVASIYADTAVEVRPDQDAQR